MVTFNLAASVPGCPFHVFLGLNRDMFSVFFYVSWRTGKIVFMPMGLHVSVIQYYSLT